MRKGSNTQDFVGDCMIKMSPLTIVTSRALAIEIICLLPVFHFTVILGNFKDLGILYMSILLNAAICILIEH